MSADYLGIRAMCEAFDVTPRTLRFYEQKELLFPLREGQKRLYSRRDRARMTLIVRGRKFGISLEEIRQLLDLYEPGREAMQIEKVLDTVKRRRDELRQERRALDDTIDELSNYIEQGEKMLRASQP